MPEQPTAHVPPGADTLLPQTPETTVTLGIPFVLFPPEKTTTGKPDNPIEEDTMEFLSSVIVIIQNPIGAYRIPFSIEGSHNIETLAEIMDPEEEQEFEDEVSQAELERNGALGIHIQTLPLSADVLTQRRKLRRAAIPSLINLRLKLTLGDADIAYLKSEDLDPNSNTFSFTTSESLQGIRREDVGKIKGSFVLAA
jgi:hypothetical protein